MHTSNSKDAHTPPDQVVKLCKLAGLDGLAVTDHNALGSTTSDAEVIVIPGIEVSSKDGHVIGLGVSAMIQRDLSADETLQRIRNAGGVSIIPHPYDLLRSSVRPNKLKFRPDAIEVINSASFLHSITWERARKFSADTGIPATGGSDSHIPETLGRAYTVVDADSRNILSVLAAVRRGSTLPYGRPLRFSERLNKIFR